MDEPRTDAKRAAGSKVNDDVCYTRGASSTSRRRFERAHIEKSICGKVCVLSFMFGVYRGPRTSFVWKTIKGRFETSHSPLESYFNNPYGDNGWPL